MIEKQVYNAYNKLRKRLKATIDSDNFFEDFTTILRAGNRTYFKHNVEVNKYIDETWVKAIEAAIPSMQTIINNPRKFIESISEVMPVELARKINLRSIKHLAANTHFINRVEDDGSVIPSKILSSYNEESFDIYENRFVMTLLNKVDHFIDIRYFVLGDKAGNEFASEVGLKGRFDQNDEKTTYNFSMKVEQGPRYLTSDTDTLEIFQRLMTVRSYIQEFKRSQFAKVMGALPKVRLPINKTNLLMKSREYRACYDLWEFLDEYTKAGYRMEILESDPAFTEGLTNEAELLILCHYLLIKNYMAEYLETQKVTQKRRREIDPKFVEKTKLEIVDAYDIKDYKTLMAAIKQGKTQRVTNTLLQAITRALDNEERRKDEEEDAARRKDQRIAEVIRNAIANVTLREKAEKERVMKTVKGAEVAMAITRTLESAGIDFDDYGYADGGDESGEGETFNFDGNDGQDEISETGGKAGKKEKDGDGKDKAGKKEKNAKKAPAAKSKIVKEGILSFEDVDDIGAILDIMNRQSKQGADSGGQENIEIEEDSDAE